MKKYIIEMFAIVKAKNKQEASDIASKLVNASLDKKIAKKLIKFSYDGGYDTDMIREYDGE